MSKKSRPEQATNPVPEPETEQQENKIEHSGPSPRRDWAGVALLIAAICVLFAGMRVFSRHLQLIDAQLVRQQERDVERAFWMISHKGSDPADRTRAFKTLVAANNQEWRIANLKHLKLARIDLSELEFKQAIFESCDLEGADLHNANFLKCGFELCDLSKANLRLADLSECGLFKADLTDANCEFIKLRQADLAQTTIHNANFQHSDLSEASLEMADLSGSDLRNANLHEAVLKDAKLVRVNLNETIMPNRPSAYGGVDFTDSNWWRARGLPITVVTNCRERFIPTKNAPQQFRDDYELWVKTESGNSR